MPLGKRTRSVSRARKTKLSYTRRVKRARVRGTTGLAGILRASVTRTNQLYRMIETKEGSQKSGVNVSLPHNNITVVQNSAGGALNIFATGNSATDPMDRNTGARIGDQINVKGVMVKAFFENALQRNRVYYRVMLLRGAKGETFDRSTIFKNDSDNKMIDQINTERFTIVAQKVFSITGINGVANLVGTNGEPLISSNTAIAAQGTKTIKMWIPGIKFGRNGNIQYENLSAQVKFYDYRICILVYDWYGTPQDINNVGKINELYTKVYFKDA